MNKIIYTMYQEQYDDNKYIIEEYQEEINNAIAICLDFRIPYEKVFKYDFILNYVYDLLDDKYKKCNILYTNEYALQKVKNEIFKSYNKKFLALRGLMQKVIINIIDYYNYLSFVFDCDIIKLITKYNKDVKQ